MALATLICYSGKVIVGWRNSRNRYEQLVTHLLYDKNLDNDLGVILSLVDSLEEQEFKEAVRSLIPSGVKGMIFGDIYLQEHKSWVERVCNEIGIEALEPLWGRSTDEILRDFIDSGFEAIIVSAQSKFIERRWIGHRVDKDFMNYLKHRGIDTCGENGEYHTLVVGGPILKRRIEITQSRTIDRDNYWLLDTCHYRLGDFIVDT